MRDVSAGAGGPTLPKDNTSSSKKPRSKKSKLAIAAIAAAIMFLILVAGSNYAHNKAQQEKFCQPLLADMQTMLRIVEQEQTKAEHLNDQLKAYLAAGIVDGPLIDSTRSLQETSMERAKHMLAEYEKAKVGYEANCD